MFHIIFFVNFELCLKRNISFLHRQKLLRNDPVKTLKLSHKDVTLDYTLLRQRIHGHTTLC